MIVVSKDKDMQDKLRQEGTLTGEGEWPFLEWSAADQSMIEAVDEPLNTSQVVSGLGDIIARLSSDAEHLRPAPKRGELHSFGCES